MRILALCVVVVLGGLLSGCGTKLNMEKSFDVTTEGNIFELEPIKHEQKIKITGSTTEGPVNVYVYLLKDSFATNGEILAKKDGPAILAKQQNTETINLDATIPAAETGVVRVTRVGKAAKVQLKITN